MNIISENRENSSYNKMKTEKHTIDFSYLLLTNIRELDFECFNAGKFLHWRLENWMFSRLTPRSRNSTEVKNDS